jgi:rubrerythrin
MDHIREGKHGARSTKQAIAIGLSKARRAGVDLPAPKEGTASSETRRRRRAIGSAAKPAANRLRSGPARPAARSSGRGTAPPPRSAFAAGPRRRLPPLEGLAVPRGEESGDDPREGISSVPCPKTSHRNGSCIPACPEVDMKKEQTELLYQALETEMGGIQVYETALRCARNDDLREEWQEYLEQTRNHERIVLEVFSAIGLDPEADTPGRQVVRHTGESLVEAMEMALSEAPEGRAARRRRMRRARRDEGPHELGAHRRGARRRSRAKRRSLKAAHDQVEDEEDEHLYHTMGWARELWLQSLGLPAVLPPPEEKKDVKTAIGAARAKGSRKSMLREPSRKQAARPAHSRDH